MSKTQLVEFIAEEAGLTKADATRALEAMIKGTVKGIDDERGYKTCVVYASEIAPQEEPADPMVYFN